MLRSEYNTRRGVYILYIYIISYIYNYIYYKYGAYILYITMVTMGQLARLWLRIHVSAGHGLTGFSRLDGRFVGWRAVLKHGCKRAKRAKRAKRRARLDCNSHKTCQNLQKIHAKMCTWGMLSSVHNTY